jgi:hypothetical protein
MNTAGYYKTQPDAWWPVSLSPGWNYISKSISTLESTVINNVNGIVFYDSVNPSSVILIDDIKVSYAQTNLLTKGKFLEDGAAVFFKVPGIYPQTGTMQLQVTSGTKTAVTKFDVAPALVSPVFCDNRFGTHIECTQKCEAQPEMRRWNSTLATSLPMHFTFATKTVFTPTSFGTQILNPDINCGAITYGLFTDGVKCCDPSNLVCACTSCAQDTTNVLWKPAPSTEQTAVYGKYPYSPTPSLNKSSGSWPGIYYDSSTNATAPPNDFTEGNVVTGASEFSNDASSDTYKGCNGTQRCTFETHNATRSTFRWTVEYDALTTVYSQNEFVPMYVGYDQEPPLATSPGAEQTSITGACEGNSLCYTEVPLCGDGVCDIKGGERCWNCEKDCNGGPDLLNGWLGDCTHDPKTGANWWTNQYGGCSRCPLADDTVTDDRGCIKKYKQEGETCSCSSGECGWGNKDSAIGGDLSTLECTFDVLESNEVVDIGHCCHSGEQWDPTYESVHNVDINKDSDKTDGACVVPRKLVAQNLRLETQDKGSHSTWVASKCCGPSRTNADWYDVGYEVVNLGGSEESFDVKIVFPQESDDNVKWYNFFQEMIATDASSPYGYSHSITDQKLQSAPSLLTQEDTGEKVACAMSDVKYCDNPANSFIAKGGTMNVSSTVLYKKHVFININITADNIAMNKSGHKYPSYLTVKNLTCDTGSNPDIETLWGTCSDGNYIQVKKDFAPSGICGGWAVPREMTGLELKSIFGRETWIPVNDITLEGMLCNVNKPATWCTIKPPLWTLGYVTAAYSLPMPCWVDCSYDACGSGGKSSPFDTRLSIH